jgi:titin
VVNATPEFDATFGTNGVSVSQVSDSADANWGKVEIQYHIRDTDTTSGSITPGYVTPSFEYNIGAGWVSIGSGNLSPGAVDDKAVGESAYTTYTAYWDAKTGVPGNYTASAQVRVTVNDNEAANNTANATGANFTLDTTNPTVTTFTIDSADDNITLNLSDNLNIEYRLSNNGDLSADGSNALSGTWQSIGNTSTTSTTDWTFTGSPSNEKVYLEVRDAVGNAASASAVAPLKPSTMEIRDISNIGVGEYREFLSWTVFSATTSSAFSKYELYRSTDDVSYSLLTTIADSNTNYHTDSTVTASTTYHYKVRYVDTDNDISNYSATVSDMADGQGGTDSTAPTISSVTVADTQATWVTITWTTDEISDSEVEYSTSAAGDYGSSASNAAYVTSHSITLGSLTPNTAYIFRVKSTDVLSNTATDDNSGAGHTFTTISGPIISSVATESVTDNSATITWNTDESADSYVVYSTSLSDIRSDTNTSEAGSAALVSTSTGGIYQHRVTLSSLTEGTLYYYYVKSTDADSNTVNDKNNNNFYSFRSTLDTQAPVISNISTPVQTASALVIVWTTNELADSQVEYGTASGSYTNTTTLDSTLSISHAVMVSSLSEETTYYFRVISADAKGNSATSDEESISTTDSQTVINVITGGGGGGGAAVDSAPPKISGIEATDISAFGATVSFKTDEPATGYVLFGEESLYQTLWPCARHRIPF